MNFIGLKIIFFVSFIYIPKTSSKDHQNGLDDPDCLLNGYRNRAQCTLARSYLVCKNGISNYWLQSTKRHIRHLRILSWPGKCFNVNQLQASFPNLENLELINCTYLNMFKGRFNKESKIQLHPKSQLEAAVDKGITLVYEHKRDLISQRYFLFSKALRLKTISMHGLPYLWEVEPEVIGQMRELRILNLTGNGLRHMKDNFLKDPPRLEKVFLANNKWDCSNGGLDWLAMEKENGTVRRRVKDYFKILCHHQLYKGKPLHRVMTIIKTVRETCPRPCACAMTHVVSDAAGTVIPLITVDCSKKQLEEPPESLPPSSTTLRLEENKISTIRHLVQNPQYKRLMDLYLDNNSIHSVKELEGTEWFSTFRVLSLRGNLLKQIPVYAFDKAFQSNNNIMHVFLGHNPWRCDCHFIPRFQGLLLKYKRVIRDLPDIRCSKSEDKTISLVQISSLPLGNVCQNNEMQLPISPINIVNIVLSVFLILVVGRFIYDWHKFKTTGNLPWISSILP